jgi:hypothetical protein
LSQSEGFGFRRQRQSRPVLGNRKGPEANQQRGDEKDAAAHEIVLS